jgi:hypothetical protein
MTPGLFFCMVKSPHGLVISPHFAIASLLPVEYSSFLSKKHNVTMRYKNESWHIFCILKGIVLRSLGGWKLS